VAELLDRNTELMPFRLIPIGKQTFRVGSNMVTLEIGSRAFVDGLRVLRRPFSSSFNKACD